MATVFVENTKSANIMVAMAAPVWTVTLIFVSKHGTRLYYILRFSTTAIIVIFRKYFVVFCLIFAQNRGRGYTFDPPH